MQMDFFKVEPNSDPSTSEAKEGTLLRIQIKMWWEYTMYYYILIHFKNHILVSPQLSRGLGPEKVLDNRENSQFLIITIIVL